jgi:very-short-patch-repair endonuclease
MDDLYRIECKVCGEILVGMTMTASVGNLTKHLTKVHNMHSKTYTVKYMHNGVAPKCDCGCGNDACYSAYKFGKYYKDHKNKRKLTPEEKLKMSKAHLERNKNYDAKLLELGITIDDLKKYWELYKTKEYNGIRLSKYANIDFRTIKRYWRAFDIATNIQIQEYTRIHKAVWSNQGKNNGSFKEIADDTILNMYLYIKQHNTITLSKLKTLYSIDICTSALYKKLKLKFPDIDEYLVYGRVSTPEKEFYYILSYYFGDKNIKRQFKLEGKSYDFLLFDKILIEYDGDYWHSIEKNIKNDNIKNNLANKYDYILLRVKDSESKNINNLLKIKELIDNVTK